MAEIRIIAVVGAGAMGAGIAQIGLTSGLDVILFDLNAEMLAKAKIDILGRIARLEEKGSIAPGFAREAEGRLKLAGSLDDLAPAEVVIEAIVERLEPKRDLFAALEKVIAPTALLATNTSSLSVAAIAAGCTRKERVCGLHFFNPVPLMKLVEVIVAPSTDADTAERATALSARLGKVPVTVKDGPGFLVNLAGRAYTTEALHILQEGGSDVATLDRIMRDGAGFRMGPFELMDLTGIDVNFPATTFIYEGYQHDARLRTTTLHELMFNAGRFGRKTGQGYHDYGGAAPARAEAPIGEAEGGAAFRAIIHGDAPGFAMLRESCGLADGDGPILIAPIGEDATTVCHREGLDPRRVVAIDFTALDRRHLTLMTALGGTQATGVAAWLSSHGFMVETIKDSPGFVLQRILAAIANLGCELAQIGVGTPKDIDTAIRLALNYPMGPLEFAEHLGTQKTYEIMTMLQKITGSDRYRPSLWLRRRALLGLPIHQAD